MFSALKKFVTNEQGDQRPSIPSGVQAMGVSLQRRFAKGIQYNMKVIIKGDRNTGKTTLFHRLQGEKFKESSIPTEEIQVASIQWNYKATDDVVKVEVWDVVDKGKPRKKVVNALKIENKETKEPEEKDEDNNPCLDASFLDVYKGTNGVVLMLDITKQWTWKYVQLELPRVPSHIPVLVMANFRDQFENQAVYREEIDYFIQELDRPPGSAHIRVAESSMKNGFGLKYLHSFFNIPFLQLQRETLLQQLQRNQLETDAMLEELDARVESEDQDYNMYLTSLSSNKNKPKTTLNVPNGQAPRRSSDTSSNTSSASATPARLSPAQTPSQVTPSSTPPTKPKQQSQRTPSSQTSSAAATPSSSGFDDESLGNRVSKWFAPSESVKQGIKVEDEKHAVVEAPAEIVHHQQLQRQKPQPTPSNISAVDDFVPDEGLDGSFFEETDSKPAVAPPQKRSIFSFRRKEKPKPPPIQPVVQAAPPPQEDSDSDDSVNPMVAGYQEELDSEDEDLGSGVTAEAAATATISPMSEEPESPFDSFSRKPPRLSSGDWSEDADARPTVAVDEGDSDSEPETPPAMNVTLSTASSKTSANQNMGWSFEIASGAASKDSSRRDTSKTESIVPSKTAMSSSSLSTEPKQNLELKVKVDRIPSSSSSSSSPAVASPLQVSSSYQDIDSSADEEQVVVLQDVEDVSDDDNVLVSVRSERTESKAASKAASKQTHGTMQEDQGNEDSEEENVTTEATNQDTVSSPSLGLTLQLEDLNFLESFGSKTAKPATPKNHPRVGDEFDVLVSVAQDEDISDAETNTSTSTSNSTKKKKKKKTKDKDEDDEKSPRKHKSKKKDKEGEEGKKERRSARKESSREEGEEKKKKKKKSSSDGTTSSSSTKKRSSGEKKEKKQGQTEGGGGGGYMDDNAALEAFLEGF